MNYVGAQSEALTGLVRVSETYIVMSQDVTALTNSQVDTGMNHHLSEDDEVDHVFLQKLLEAELEAPSAILRVSVRVLGDLEGYLRLRAVSLNGTFARSGLEASVGELLARRADISVNETRPFRLAGRSSASESSAFTESMLTSHPVQEALSPSHKLVTSRPTSL